MFLEKPNTATLQEMLDKFAVKELVEFERYARDNRMWDQMAACYAKNSHVKVSWYEGDGAGFVEKSKSLPQLVLHKLYNTLVWVSSDRAISVTMSQLCNRNVIEGRDYDLLCNVRFLYQLVREDGEWKIFSFKCVYENDALVPSFPHDLTVADGGPVRESYGSMMKLKRDVNGVPIDGELPGDDWPGSVEAVLDEARVWLEGKSNGIVI